MKTLASSLRFAESDPAQFRLHVLKHGTTYGVTAAITAFGISRRTYFLWQKTLRESNGRLVSLVPKSTRPQHLRTMTVDARLLELIRELRETYGRIGKEKLVILVAAYAKSLGIPGYGATKIGKIISRNHYFFEYKKKRTISGVNRKRMKRSPKNMPPGYLEMDCVHVWVQTSKLVFVTVIDVATRVAYAARVNTASSCNTATVLQHFQSQYRTPVHTLQTDNGSEFLGEFHDYLETHQITHLFSYPRSPKINGYIERFNRTLQEEFIDRCDAWVSDKAVGDQKLIGYLNWYNGKRPHASLHYQAPLVYLKTSM
jgi:hypothetical protein